MPMSDAQYDDLMAQMERAGKAPPQTTPEPPVVETRIVWRAQILHWIAWCLGISNHVITRAVR